MAWHQILCLKILFFVEKIGQNERPSPQKKTKKGVPSEGEGYVEKTVESEEHPLPGWPTRCRRRQTNCILVHSSCQTHSASCVSVQDRSEWILALLLGHPMYEVTKSPSVDLKKAPKPSVQSAPNAASKATVLPPHLPVAVAAASTAVVSWRESWCHNESHTQEHS